MMPREAMADLGVILAYSKAYTLEMPKMTPRSWARPGSGQGLAQARPGPGQVAQVTSLIWPKSLVTWSFWAETVQASTIRGHFGPGLAWLGLAWAGSWARPSHSNNKKPAAGRGRRSLAGGFSSRKWRFKRQCHMSMSKWHEIDMSKTLAGRP